MEQVFGIGANWFCVFWSAMFLLDTDYLIIFVTTKLQISIIDYNGSIGGEISPQVDNYVRGA